MEGEFGLLARSWYGAERIFKGVEGCRDWGSTSLGFQDCEAFVRFPACLLEQDLHRGPWSSTAARMSGHLAGRRGTSSSETPKLQIWEFPKSRGPNVAPNSSALHNTRTPTKKALVYKNSLQLSFAACAR